MTYSIIARDPQTGLLGAAVQSHYFNVGVDTIFVEAGVGAIASQAMAEAAHGYRGLDLLRRGLDAPATLRALLSVDSGAAVRQVAMLDCEGRVAAHTGERCIRFASHHVGDGYSVQANMMRGEGVVPAMSEAFECSTGRMEQRLFRALEAAESEGGDIRGQQSVALRVVAGAASGRPWEDVRVDLRVDDHREPIQELGRLLDVHRAFELMQKSRFEQAEGLAPGNLEIPFWHGVSLLVEGRTKDAGARLARVFAADPRWEELLGRLPAAGILSEELLRELGKASRGE